MTQKKSKNFKIIFSNENSKKDVEISSNNISLQRIVDSVSKFREWKVRLIESAVVDYIVIVMIFSSKTWYH